MSTVKLLLDFHAATQLPFPATAQWADKLYTQARTDPNWLCVERPGGVLIGMVGPSLLGPFKVAQEVAWWVDPAHRGGSVGMLRAYEEWAISKGVFAIEVKSLAMFPQVEALYARAGYSRLETSWVRWL
jgi:RimJ/RimL family protein N-acetyltransferase